MSPVTSSPATVEKRVAYFIPIEGYVEGKGYNVGIAVEDQPGYNKTDWFWNCSYESACALAMEKNERLGLKPKEACLVVLSSISASSWGTPLLTSRGRR